VAATEARRLAVLGHPIAHSKSPALHTAAYAALGLPWSYGAADVESGSLGTFIDDLGTEWRGLSLTMPLKREVLPLLDSVDELVMLSGAANTVLLDRQAGRATLRGFNTDVYGVIEALRGGGVTEVATARILGGGATAASVLIALHRLGVERVAIAARAPEKLGELIAIAEQLDIELTIETLGAVDSGAGVEVVVSTLPNGADAAVSAGDPTGRVLLDVAYEPWPTSLATLWLTGGGVIVPGLEMLVHQALAQVKIFVGGSADVALPNEDAIFEAMRHAVGLAPL
jgi:shikimate dehydrogenase